MVVQGYKGSTCACRVRRLDQGHAEQEQIRWVGGVAFNRKGLHSFPAKNQRNLEVTIYPRESASVSRIMKFLATS